MGDLPNQVLTPVSQSRPNVTMHPPTDAVEISPRSVTGFNRWSQHCFLRECRCLLKTSAGVLL